MKKLLLGITGLILLIIMWFPCSIFVDAAEGPLYVYDGDVLVKTYSFQDLQAKWQEEGSLTYRFTGYNTYGSYKPFQPPLQASGPTVTGLLAGAGISPDQLTNRDLIDIKGSDGYTLKLTKEQLMADRYYYPHGESGTDTGKAGDDASCRDRELVPIIIDTSDVDHSSTLRIGQIWPNERNWSAHVQNMTGSKGGKIYIRRGAASALPANMATSVDTEQYVLPGQNIKLYGGNHAIRVYYTTDGSEPTAHSDIYNYNSYPGSEQDATITAPGTEGATIVIKSFLQAYGDYDSPVQTFTYTVNTAAVQRILNDRKVVKGQTYTVGSQKYKVTGKSAGSNGTVTFTKAKKAKTATVPATVKLADGKTYQVTAIGAKAFAGTKATKIILKTKKLKKSSVKGSLKGSKVKTVKVKVGTKKQNATYVKKYKKIFTKKNAGRKVKVTR